MKKILIYIWIAIIFASCTNQEIEYPDYKLQTVYFPVQYPVRTLVLGETQYDNAMDREHAFTIAVNIGGMYENTKERTVFVKYAPEVVTNSALTKNGGLATETVGDTIKVLPPNYYTPDLSTLEKIIIPAGSFDGRIKIQLKDEFFQDPKTVGVKYVIPLVILSETEDSVMSGVLAAGALPDRVKTSNWTAGYLPYDYTLFAIKYTNKYHGNYFHFGKDSLVLNGTFVKTKSYGTTYIEDNTTTLVKTTSLTDNTINRLGGTNIGSKYTVSLKLNSDNTIVVKAVDGAVVASGTGKFIPAANGGKVWGGSPRNTIILDYSFTDVDGIHWCKDTLVYRSNGIVYQDYKIKQ